MAKNLMAADSEIRMYTRQKEMSRVSKDNMNHEVDGEMVLMELGRETVVCVCVCVCVCVGGGDGEIMPSDIFFK